MSINVSPTCYGLGYMENLLLVVNSESTINNRKLCTIIMINYSVKENFGKSQSLGNTRSVRM